MGKTRPYYQSSSFIMALLFTLLLGMSVSILSYFGYYFSKGHYVHSAENLIDSEIKHLSAYQASGTLTRYLSDEKNFKERLYFLSAPDGSYIAGNMRTLPSHMPRLAEGTITIRHEDRVYAARIHTFANGQRLLLGVDMTDVSRNFILMKWLSVLSIVLMIAVIGISFLISYFVVSRSNRIARTAQDIMETGNLSQRLNIDSRWDDLSYVAGVLNTFLERIETLISNVRQVSDNIAHDLRTPLMRLRADLEKLKQEDPAHPERYDIVVAEADHILTIFAALLRIGTVEAGKMRSDFKPVSLSKILFDVVDLYEPLAEERGIHIACDVKDPSVSVEGDADLIFQAIANILDNALKFTPHGGQVVINLSEVRVLTIRDTGPGVGAQELEHIFNRFYRSEASRHTPGNGLGLSMVKAVMAAHGGSVRAENAEPGLAFILTFPG
jgi:signal transduction histidine kinase